MQHALDPMQPLSPLQTMGPLRVRSCSLSPCGCVAAPTFPQLCSCSGDAKAAGQEAGRPSYALAAGRSGRAVQLARQGAGLTLHFSLNGSAGPAHPPTPTRHRLASAWLIGACRPTALRQIFLRLAKRDRLYWRSEAGEAGCDRAGQRESLSM